MEDAKASSELPSAKVLCLAGPLDASPQVPMPAAAKQHPAHKNRSSQASHKHQSIYDCATSELSHVGSPPRAS